MEVHQQTLVLVTQVEAEKQAAQLKVENLENEISSCDSHINTLKDELAAACQRQFSDDEVYQYGKTHLVSSESFSFVLSFLKISYLYESFVTN